MATLFFSYSHADEALRNELEVHLAMLKREGLIDTWHDRRILAGDVLDEAINAKLSSADVVLSLISPEFLASRYCYDVEMKRAMARQQVGGCRVIAVILRPCDWQSSPFAKLLVTPKDGKPVTKWPDRDEAFLDVVQQIRKALPAVQPVAAAASAPVALPTGLPAVGPRSSNMRLRQQFTEADRDRYLEDGFEFIARYFDGSLTELAQRNEGIETRFKRIDAHSFGAVIYRGGEAVARCGIRLRGSRGFGITYSNDDSAPSNIHNESLTVDAGEQSLFFKPMGMQFYGTGVRSQRLTPEGAAEYYWSLLIEPLQR